MQPIDVSTVIVGNWNPKIFTPAWIKTNLFQVSKDEQLEGLVNFDDMEFGFQRTGIALFPKPNLVEVRCEGYDEIKALKTAGIIIRVLELLPQTPIKALGVNIRYAIPRTAGIKFAKSLSKIDRTFGDFEISQIKHTLNKGSYQINIITDISNDLWISSFNFHYNKLLIPFDSNFIVQHFKETQGLLKDGN